MTAPNTLKLFAFNVGFGDCFLLRFGYPEGINRHVLIDFGAHPAPKRRGHMKKIADTIASLCGRIDGAGGELDIVVATHRHKDHISGFATAPDGNGTGDIIASLNPKMVLQPWTENPEIAEDATNDDSLMAGTQAFKASLDSMNAFAAALPALLGEAVDSNEDAQRFQGEPDTLRIMGENNIPNRSAVENLRTMGGGDKGRYLHADQPLDVSQVLPGVSVKVLGPPTVKQHPAVASQNPDNEEQYWQLLAADAQAASQSGSGKDEGKQQKPPLFPSSVVDMAPYARWMRYRLGKLKREMLLPIVRTLDTAMNNTSLILLFQAGGKSFLFPGDAQWENWEYALRNDRYVELLRNVDLYKVGHHGSRNATPRRLWDLFNKRGDGGTADRLTSVMSTLHGVHGDSDAKTEVPRMSLVEALKNSSDLHSTEDLEAGRLYDEMTFEL